MGHVLVTDQNCRRVQVFDSTKVGDFLFGVFFSVRFSLGTGDGQFQPSRGVVCVDLLLNGQIAVVDQMNKETSCVFLSDR